MAPVTTSGAAGLIRIRVLKANALARTIDFYHCRLMKVTDLFSESQTLYRLLTLWVYGSLCTIFSLLLWQQSTGAGLNIYDAVISLPSLLVLAPVMAYRGWLNQRFWIKSAPMFVYLGLILASLTWAESPDISKTARAVGQVLALYVLFSYLQLSGNFELLKSALFFACGGTALVAAWHLIVMYGVLNVPWEMVLYEGVAPDRLEQFGVKPINAMLATLLIAPQAAMMLGLVANEKKQTVRFMGLVALAVLVVFLVALERRTGQVAILSAVATCAFIYRSRTWYILCGAAFASGVFVYFMFPEFVLSRGASWRPEIWMATINAISESPFFGHGVANKITPVLVYDNWGRLLGTFRHPHNLPLAITYYLGVVGLFFWLCFWVPSAFSKLFDRVLAQREGYMLIPLIVGLVAMMFDGGHPLPPFHFSWFCFWVPVSLLVSSQACVPRR